MSLGPCQASPKLIPEDIQPANRPSIERDRSFVTRSQNFASCARSFRARAPGSATSIRRRRAPSGARGTRPLNIECRLRDIFGTPARLNGRSLRLISCAGCSLPSAPEFVVIITWSDEDRVSSTTAPLPRDVLLHLSRHLAELDHPLRRPIRANIFVLVPGALIGSKDLQMSSFDFVDGSDVSAVAVHDRHPLDHKIKQRSSFRTVIRMLSHCFLHLRRQTSEIRSRSTSHRKASDQATSRQPRPLLLRSLPKCCGAYL